MKAVKLLTLSSFLVLAACNKETLVGEGPVITEQRFLYDFTGIQLSGSTNIIVSYGSTYSIQVRGFSNLLPYFETKVVNGVLELGYRNLNVKNDNTQVMITLPHLTGLATYGSGNIQVNGNFSGFSLESVISGSGNIFIERGSFQDFYSAIAGSGNIQAFGIVVDRAETSISGNGNVEITALDLLKARISGSGSVYYKGNPIVDSQISGSGRVIRK